MADTPKAEGFQCDRCGDLVARPRKSEVDICSPCRAEIDEEMKVKRAEYNRVFLRSRRASFRLTDPPFSTKKLHESDIEYAHLEPIKRALEKCAEDVSNQLDPDSKYLLVRKSDWKNLCDVIRAGSL